MNRKKTHTKFVRCNRALKKTKSFQYIWQSTHILHIWYLIFTLKSFHFSTFNKKKEFAFVCRNFSRKNTHTAIAYLNRKTSTWIKLLAGWLALCTVRALPIVKFVSNQTIKLNQTKSNGSKSFNVYTPFKPKLNSSLRWIK